MLTHVLYNCTEGRVILLSKLSKKLAALGVRGASVSNLSRIFQGQHEPGYPLLKGLSKVFNLSIEEVGKILERCKMEHETISNHFKEFWEDESGETTKTKGGG